MPAIYLPLHYSNRNYRVSPNKAIRTNRIVRLAGVAFLCTMFWNLLWVLTSLNLHSRAQIAFTALFVIATLMVLANAILHTINNWHFRIAEPKLLEGEAKPEIAIIIPTYGESIAIVTNTIKSVLLQEWPAAKMLILVVDDGRNELLKTVIERMAETTEAKLTYLLPPKKDSPLRRGESKAGSLNAALDYVTQNFPDIEYIETRDADDLVANRHFISHCLEYLQSHPETSFVQTVKECRVSDGDPFSNQERLFYQRAMPAKFAANAVFPCGSGLVWRRRDLQKIDGFPSWNLVEDLQSGYEILRRGGKGAFLPIVGALGQIAPEDIPNFYKQRGTWALDTLRLFYYKNPLFTKGLNIWQKLHFLELQFSYLLSFAMAIFIFEIVVCLNMGMAPIVSSNANYFLHAVLLAAAIEAHSIARARGISYGEQWRTRQIWLGLMPVFIVSAIRALRYGPNKKPSYKVTRKYHQTGWYWRQTITQTLILLVLLASVCHSVVSPHSTSALDVGLQFWALYLAYGFSRVVTNSWHNYRLPLGKLSLRRLSEA